MVVSPEATLHPAWSSVSLLLGLASHPWSIPVPVFPGDPAMSPFCCGSKACDEVWLSDPK